MKSQNMINKAFLTFFVALCTMATQASEKVIKTIHVSPTGQDSNNGSSNEPLKTLHAAQEAVRKIRSQKGNIEVILHGGTYQLDKLLHFTNKDSAPEGSYTVFKAKDGEEPIISGGKTITNWQKLTDFPEHLPQVAQGKVYVADLDWLNDKTRFHALMSGKTFLPRARSGAIKVFSPGLKADQHAHLDEMKYRTQFHYKVGKVTESKGGKGKKKKKKGKKASLENVLPTTSFAAGDNSKAVSKDPFRQWDNLDDIEIYTQPTKLWLVNYLTVKSIDTDKKVVQLKTHATYSMSKNPAFIENAIDFLDKPGEWCINTKTQKIYYWPKSGKPESNLTATYLDEIIRVEGVTDSSLAGKNEKPVRGIVFKGLTLSHADRQRWEVDDIGIQHDWDMWDKDSGLIRFKSAQDCKVTECKFVNTASGAVRLDLFAQNITVEKSHFENLGGVGVTIAGYGPGLKDVNKNNAISHNVITKPGQIFLHSPAVFVWQSGSNRINNNHVYDLAYTGMVFAGVRRRFFRRLHEGKVLFPTFFVPENSREHMPTIRWDEVKIEHGLENWESYEPFMHTRNNIIEYNEVHDTMKKLHDGNCIYMSANGNGNIIRHNVAYNHLKGASIRTDDDAHGCTVEGNLIFGTISSLGIRIKGLNECNNNFLINSYLTTGRAGNTCFDNSTFKNNVLYHTRPNKAPFHINLNMVVAENFDNNTFFHTNPEILAAKKAAGLKVNEKGQDKHSVYQDPMFVDITQGNFSFKSNSPSLKLKTKTLPADFLKQVGPSYDPFLNRYLKNKEALLNPKRLKAK